MLAVGIGVILIMAGLAAFAYLSFNPPYANKNALSVFNKMTIAVVAVLTILFYLNGKSLLPLSDNLREMMSLIFAFLLELFLLVLLFLVRNFWLFKPPKR